MDAPTALVALHAQARAAWPSVTLGLEDFCAHARARGFTGEGPQAAHAGDLLLACACARGLPAALVVFEREVLPPARHALLRRGLPHPTVDEVLQALRERLLVARPDAPPRVGDFDGRGPLVAWVRTAALRLALAQGQAARPSAELVSGLVAPGDVELAALQQRHRAQFEAALTEALQALELRERTLLRMHLLENVRAEDIGRIHGVSRATVTRWLKAARDSLFARTRERLRERLGLGDAEFDSLARLLLSQVDVSVRRLLGEDPAR